MSENKSGPDRRLYLVDGSGYIFRAYFALPALTRKRDGLPTGAVSGFCNMLNKLLEDALADAEVDHFAVIFDAARETFRNEIYPEYKANRPEPPEDLVPQFGLIKEASRAFSLATIEMPGFEADDVIATYARMAREAGVKVTIVSSDKDLMQLVRPGVEMLDPMKSRHIGPAEVVERFGVGPDKVVDVQALAGDSTDNVPGVPGIGVKTAAQLVNEYGDLDSLLKRADEIKQPKRRQTLIENAELARISRELVRLRDDVPVPMALEGLEIRPLDAGTLLEFLEDLDFQRLAQRIRAKLAGDGDAAQASLGTEPPAETEYELVQTGAALERWIKQAEAVGYVAFDTETTSLDAKRAELVGFSLAIQPGRACYVPVGHTRPAAQASLDLAGETKGDGVPKQLGVKTALGLIKSLLESPAVLKIGQNIKYDALVLARYGVKIWPVDDTMLLSYVAEAGLYGHGMDELSELHLGIKPISFKEVAGSGKNQISFAEVPLDKATEYAAEDADLTLRLHAALKPRLVKERVTTVYETLERALIPVLVEMESHGIRVDPDELKRLSGDFAQRMAGLEDEIYKLAGESVQHRLAQAAGRAAVRQDVSAGRAQGQDRGL